MKKSVAVAALLAASLAIAGCVVPGAMLVTAILMKPKELGDWSGRIEGVRTEVSFGTEGNVTISVQYAKLGLEAGTPVAMRYEIDDSDSPIYIDFIPLDASGEPQTRRIKGIMNYISDTVMTLCVSLDGINRPDSFKTVADRDIYSVVLSKVK